MRNELNNRSCSFEPYTLYNSCLNLRLIRESWIINVSCFYIGIQLRLNSFNSFIVFFDSYAMSFYCGSERLADIIKNAAKVFIQTLINTLIFLQNAYYFSLFSFKSGFI